MKTRFAAWWIGKSVYRVFDVSNKRLEVETQGISWTWFKKRTETPPRRIVAKEWQRMKVEHK